MRTEDIKKTMDLVVPGTHRENLAIVMPAQAGIQSRSDLGTALSQGDEATGLRRNDQK